MWQHYHPAGVKLSKYDRETSVKQMQHQLQVKFSRSRCPQSTLESINTLKGATDRHRETGDKNMLHGDRENWAGKTIQE